MYFSVFALATLPFLAAAIHLPRSHRHFHGRSGGVSIPIAKRGYNVTHTVDVSSLKAQAHHSIEYAPRGITVFSSDLASLAWTESFTMASTGTSTILAVTTPFL